MKLLRESEIFDLQILTEGEGSAKGLFIEGCFAQSEKRNRNGRIYPKQVMESSMGKYLEEFVNARRAIGELSHPENRPMPKPEFASHLITSLKFEGNDVIGKARILNTPQGKVVQGLLEGGVQLGVSTRGLGSIEEKSGTSYVKNDYLVTAIDVVGDPSGIDCWVNAVNESREWVFIDGRFEEREIEQAKNAIKASSSKNLQESMINEFQKFMKAISS